MKRVRNQDITVKAKFALDRMWLELAIDLNDLLRDGRVLWIGEWDTDGAFVFFMYLSSFMSHSILKETGLKKE